MKTAKYSNRWIYEAASKIRRVIESCETPEQLKVAEKMASRFCQNVYDIHSVFNSLPWDVDHDVKKQLAAQETKIKVDLKNSLPF